MSLIKSLMGRRQFLISAGVTSTSVMFCKKIASYIDPGFQTNVAMGAERSGTAVVKGASKRYTHLLSPLKIRNTLLKNRMLYKVSIPHFLQGPETFPSEEVRTYYSNIAKTADSVVIYAGLKPKTDEAMKFSNSANQVLLLGDCTGKNGNIQKTMRSAFFTASQI
jgi:hypothetical protein